jgi:lactoylglutathione lyase
MSGKDPVNEFDARYWVWGSDAHKPRVLHTMIRVSDFEAALRFYVDGLGMAVKDRYDIEARRVTAIYLGFGDYAEGGVLELAHNWDATEPCSHGSGYGHLAIGVPDIDATIAKLKAMGAEVTLPPTRYFAGAPQLAFVKDPDGYSIELIQTRRDRELAAGDAESANREATGGARQPLMKLYTSPSSPFGMRVVLAARAKGVEIECVRPSSGVKSKEFLAMNPIGKIPLLITDSGRVIPESLAILHYLEDRFPNPSLLPSDPDERARVNVAVQIMDSYVMAPVIRTFPHLDPRNRDQLIVDREVARWKEGAAALDHFMSAPLTAAAAGISLADCVLPFSFHLSARIAGMLGLSGDPLMDHERLSAYYAGVRRHPVIGPMLEALTAAQAEQDARRAAAH